MPNVRLERHKLDFATDMQKAGAKLGVFVDLLYSWSSLGNSFRWIGSIKPYWEREGKSAECLVVFLAVLRLLRMVTCCREVTICSNYSV